MDPIECMSPRELTLLSFLIAVYICEGRDAGYLNVLGNLLVATGGLILVWAAQAEFRKQADNNTNNPDDSTSKQ